MLIKIFSTAYMYLMKIVHKKSIRDKISVAYYMSFVSRHDLNKKHKNIKKPCRQIFYRISDRCNCDKQIPL